jgi:hypothetical protein
MKFEYVPLILTFTSLLFTTSKTGGYVPPTLAVRNCSMLAHSLFLLTSFTQQTPLS